jgi:dolichol-phosphate mannosyltransferase
MDLTVIITTINEAENLALLIPPLRSALDAEKAVHEILVIDGPSTDGTPEIARSLGCRVEKQTSPGYAQAIREGLRSARGNRIIVMDADGSHSPDDAARLYRHRDLADIVINSRYVQGGGSQTQLFRSLLSRFLNFCYRSVLGLPFREISGGFRIYRREIFQRCELESKFYEVQEEMLIKPYWLGYRVAEIPYVYRERVHGVSKAKLMTVGFHLMLAMVRFRLSKAELLRKKRTSSVSSPARSA